jgi:hypothetical protein
MVTHRDTGDSCIMRNANHPKHTAPENAHVQQLRAASASFLLFPPLLAWALFKNALP